MSNTPVITWSDTGLSAPNEQDILAGRLADFNDAFGGNLNTTNLESPQGQLSTSDAVIIGEYNDTILKLVNQVDPRYASGFMQDAIGQIYFLERKPATATVVTVTCAGVAFTTIPAGALVKDDNNEVYQNVSDGQIGSGGTGDFQFQNINKGAIPCATGTINRIYDRLGAFGWESVSNAADGDLGQDEESRADFEARRNNSVFLGSQGSLDSAYAAVFNVDNVVDVFATQNLTDSDVDVGATAYTLHPKEVFICVRGGTNKAVATAIYSKITGATLVGNTIVAVKSAITNFSNDIVFNRPTSYAILFEVNIVDSPDLPSNTEDLVQQAIIDAFNGLDGGEKARIGQTVYASRFYQPVISIDSTIKLDSILVGHSAATDPSVPVGIDQFPTISISDITVNFI